MEPSAPDADELRDLVAALPDLVILVGPDRRVRHVNRYEMGYTAADVIGLPTTEFIPPEARERHLRLLDRVFETGEPAADLAEVVGADGETEWYEGTMVPLVKEGSVTAVAIITRNVTARVRAEKEVEILRNLLPICAWCRQVRTEDGEWKSLEAYLEAVSHSRVTHGMCPDCAQRMMEEDRSDPGGDVGPSTPKGEIA